MTDTQTPGGWDGRPENPQRDGWCWLSYSLPRIPQVAPSCFRWSADNDAWMVNNSPISPARMASLGWYFVARVLTPAEVAARVDAARREGLRDAADVCDDLHEHTPGICAAAIRALLEDKR